MEGKVVAKKLCNKELIVDVPVRNLVYFFLQNFCYVRIKCLKDR